VKRTALTVIAALVLLTLGVAPALGATPKPKLGRTVVLRPAGGTVLVKPRGGKRFKLKKATAIPVGSVVDTTYGKVKLTSARDSKHTQSGDFSQGAFVVTQQRDGLTDLQLTGGNFGVCTAAHAAGKHLSAAANRRRGLLGHAHGRFRTRGRNSSATVRGTDWLTADDCNGTVVVNKSANKTSQVDTSTRNIEFHLEPGQTATGYCNRLDIAPDTFCVMLLAQPADGVIGAGIITQVDTPSYALCVAHPNGNFGCSEFPLTERDADGFRLGVLACPVSAPGEYFVGWSVDFKDDTPTLLDPPGALSLTLDVAGPNVPCKSVPEIPPAA
jgi:hypothetical protein